jgi:formamidopyrimidine-DNA glycosylase
MPELPEVEVLVRHLDPLLRQQVIRGVRVRRSKVIAPASARVFARAVVGARFSHLSRRGKYLLFQLQAAKSGAPLTLVGHLGMTGRMYLLPAQSQLPKHAAVVLNLGRRNFVFEDTRYFGRLTLDGRSVGNLGPEPLAAEFTLDGFARALKRSKQAIKVRLLDQSLVAGVGNIYASEALFRAGVAPSLPARALTREQVTRLRTSIRAVLREAIRFGSTVPLNHSGAGAADGLFYFGLKPGSPDFYEERLRVYDRAGKPCCRCGSAIQRCVQGARSTYYCPHCQAPNAHARAPIKRFDAK